VKQRPLPDFTRRRRRTRARLVFLLCPSVAVGSSGLKDAEFRALRSTRSHRFPVAASMRLLEETRTVLASSRRRVDDSDDPGVREQRTTPIVPHHLPGELVIGLTGQAACVFLSRRGLIDASWRWPRRAHHRGALLGDGCCSASASSPACRCCAPAACAKACTCGSPIACGSSPPTAARSKPTAASRTRSSFRCLRPNDEGPKRTSFVVRLSSSFPTASRTPLVGRRGRRFRGRRRG
jgi:hypothetical protein